MREGSVLEGVDVVADRGWVDSAFLGSLLEKEGVVETLSTRSDLLASHEEVVGAGEVWIVLARHGIERPGFLGVAMEHVEIGIVFLTN